MKFFRHLGEEVLFRQALLVLFCCLHAAVAHAQVKTSLFDVLRESLVLNPGTQLQRQQVLANEGAVQQAEGQFDPTIIGNIARTNTQRTLRQGERDAISNEGISDSIRSALGLRLSTPTTVDTQVSNAIDYSTGVQAMLQNGMTVGATFGVTTTYDNVSAMAGVQPQTNSRVGFTLRAPLLRNAGTEANTANLSAAELELTAARSDMVFVNAQTLLGTALAYWDYLGRARRLDIARNAEARAGRLLEEVRKLIGADQLPSADSQLVQASYSERAANRIAAEQSLTEGRRALAQQIGLSAQRASELGPPGDEFPVYDGKPVVLDAQLAALQELALARRADLAAAKAREEAARRRVDLARSGTKPQLDFTVGMNYGGLIESRVPFAVNPLVSNMAGPSISASVSGQLPWRNSAATGTLQVQSAALDSNLIRVRTLQDTIGNSVYVDVQGLVRGAQQLARAIEATRLYVRSVENETTKRRMGLSTLIDVLNVEDRLTNALFSEVQARQSYANAIAQLRFDTGTIVTPRDDGFELLVDDFLFPRFDFRPLRQN